MSAKSSFMRRAPVLAALFLVAGAASPPATLEQLVLMHVDGKLTIETDGSVGEMAFDTKFDPGLRDALEAKMRAWRFEPVRVGGAPRRAETAFSVTLAAEQREDKALVRIDGTRFGPQDNATATAAIVPDGVAAPITARRMLPPQYPADLMRSGKIGRVRLVIRVAPDGRAAEVVAAQSLVYDFGGREPATSARRSIRVFEAASIQAARNWTFNVPAGAASRKPDDMTVSTDVEYQLRYDTSAAGQWVPVLRAPARAAAWLPPERGKGSALGVGAAGQLAGVDSPYKLATPVAGNVVM
jgi:hypothetical protein